MASDPGASGHVSQQPDTTTTMALVISGVVLLIICLSTLGIHRHLRLRPARPARQTDAEKGSGLTPHTLDKCPIVIYHAPGSGAGYLDCIRKLFQSAPSERPTRRRRSSIPAVFRDSLYLRRCSSGGTPEILKREDPSICSICSDGFVEYDRLRSLPCSHVFHQPCIDQWLSKLARTCPLWYVASPSPDQTPP